MSNYFAAARAFLASIDPAAPAAALVLTVFFAIYALRRWAPRVWIWIEGALPFVDKLDYRPVATIVSKFMQALPGALLGAAVASLSSGASVKNAVLGVLAGFGASLVHEVMAAYKGEVSDPKPPTGAGPMVGMLMLTFYLSLGLCGCAALAAAVPYLAEAAVVISDALNDLQIVSDLVAKFPGLSDATRAKLEQKLQAAHMALEAAAAADNGAKDLTAEQLDASFAQFRTAWVDLSDALTEAGIVPGAKLGASNSDPIFLPRPLALRPIVVK